MEEGGGGVDKLMFTQATITQRGRGYEVVEFTRINKQKDTPPHPKRNLFSQLERRRSDGGLK